MAKSRPPGPCNFFWMKVVDKNAARADAAALFSEVPGAREPLGPRIERSPLPVIPVVKNGTYVISLAAAGYALEAGSNVKGAVPNVVCEVIEAIGPRPLAFDWIDSPDGQKWRGSARQVFFFDAALVPLD